MRKKETKRSATPELKQAHFSPLASLAARNARSDEKCESIKTELRITTAVFRHNRGTPAVALLLRRARARPRAAALLLPGLRARAAVAPRAAAGVRWREQVEARALASDEKCGETSISRRER